MTRARGRVATIVVALGAAVPAIVSGLRAFGGHWAPVIDNGVIAVRSHDVFGARPPLLGTYTSLTVVAHAHQRLYHLGPLEFWLFAIPERLFGTSSLGLVAGASALNGLAAAGIVVVGARLGGRTLMTVGAFTVALLAWSLGGQVLHDPWNAHLGLFPFAFLVFAAAAVAAGDVLVLPFMMFAASVVAQVFVPSLVPVAFVVGVACAVLLVSARRGGAPPRTRAALIAAALVFVACWSGPIVDQLAGRGNLGAVIAAGLHGKSSLGFGPALRQLVHATAIPPMWFHPVLELLSVDPALNAAAIVTSVLVLGALVAFGGWAVRAGQRAVAALATTALVACVAGVLTTANTPSAYRYTEFVYPRRIWWVIGIVTWAALAYALVAFSRYRLRDRGGFGRLARAGAVPGLVAIALAVGFAWPRLGVRDDYGSAGFGPVRHLGGALAAALAPDGRWWLRSEGGFAGTIVTPGVAGELVAHGRTVLMDDRSFPDLGPSHYVRRHRPTGTVLVVSTPSAGQPRRGYRLVALWDPAHAPEPYAGYQTTMLGLPDTVVAAYVRTGR